MSIVVTSLQILNRHSFFYAIPQISFCILIIFIFFLNSSIGRYNFIKKHSLIRVTYYNYYTVRVNVFFYLCKLFFFVLSCSFLRFLLKSKTTRSLRNSETVTHLPYSKKLKLFPHRRGA